MNKKFLFRIAVFCLFLLSTGRLLFAQAPDSTTIFSSEKRHRVIGLNMSPLLILLMPFNNSNITRSGPYNLSFKSYKNNHAFRMGIGAAIDQESNISQNDIVRFNMYIGYEHRRKIYEKLYYTAGVDFIFFGGGLNTPLVASSVRDGLGIGSVWGVEYEVLPRISVSTETTLFFGYTGNDFDSSFSLLFIPPVSIFLNMKLGKKR